MIRKIIKTILLLIWLIVIFCFSSDNGIDSTNKSDGFIINTIEFIKGSELTTKEKEIYIDKLVTPVRKGAHFTEYFILGILVYSLFSEFFSKKQLIIYSIIFCFLYACSDEIHQLFVVGRSAKFLDVIIDTLGSFTGIFIFDFIKNKIYKENVL